MGNFLHRSLRFGIVLWLVMHQAIGQDRVVSGKITSNDEGTVLPGVSVVIKGTTRGTNSDAEGNYKVTARPGETLIFSFIGMVRKEVKVGTANTLNVELMSDASQLNEVIVTALGIKQEKRRLGYAVQEVKGQEIADTQRDNFLVSLQGRVAGLSMTTTSGTPGASAQITLRGASSIGGNNSPLYVVDGLPISNNTFGQGALVTDQPNRSNDYINRAADINPNDIEALTILKGPEAAALYGIEAAGGAIVITTKKGKAGRGSITYDTNFRFENVYRFPAIQQVYGRGINGVLDPNTQSFFGPKFGENTQIFDNKNAFLQTGRTQQHNLSFDGGTEKATYRLSTSYTNQQGTVPTSTFEKLSVRLSSSVKLTPKLTMEPSFNFISTKIGKIITSDQGILLSLLRYPSNDDMTNFLTPAGNRRRLLADNAELDNPFFNVNKNKNTDRTNRIIGNINLNYAPTNWLTFSGRFGADIYSTLGNFFMHPESNRGIAGRGFIENYTENSQLLNANFFATATKNVGKFETKLLLGTTVDDNTYEVTSTYGEQLYIPDYNSINNTLPTTQRNKLTLRKKRLLSVLGSFNMSYNDLLHLTITGRNDWSSTLPVANNAFFYPSVSLSYEFTKMAALKNSTLLSDGKLRVSYAQVGKDAPPYLVQSSLTPQTTTGGGFGYGFFGGNPDLKPEFSEAFEAGFDLFFLKNRIELDVAVYQNTRSKQIVSQRLSYGTGFVFGLLNGGTFSNRGLEVQLNAKIIKKPSFSWDANLNFTTLTTSVRDLPAGVPEYYNSDTWLFGNARASAFVGMSDLQKAFSNFNLVANERGAGSATAIGGWSYLRNPRGEILINPTNGLPILNTNFLPIGDRNPTFTMGLQNSFRYKNFRVSFLLDIRQGGDVFNGNERYLMSTGLSPRTLDRDTPVIFNGVLRDGRENSDTPTANTIAITPSAQPLNYYAAFPESEFVERDINWVRMRDARIEYQFPKTVIARTKVFQNMSVFVNGTDLFLITNYTGADPNVNGTTASSTGVGAAGFDYGKLSVPRGLAFGLRFGL